MAAGGNAELKRAASRLVMGTLWASSTECRTGEGDWNQSRQVQAECTQFKVADHRRQEISVSWVAAEERRVLW